MFSTAGIIFTILILFLLTLKLAQMKNKTGLHKSLFILIGSIAAYNFGNLNSSIYPDDTSWLLFVGLSVFPSSLLFFVISFLKTMEKKAWSMLHLSIIISACLIVSLYTPLFETNYWKWIYTSFAFSTSIYSIYMLFKNRTKISYMAKQNRLDYISVGIVTSFFIALIKLLPIIKFDQPNLLSLFTLILPVMATTSVIKKRLYDTRLLLGSFIPLLPISLLFIIANKLSVRFFSENAQLFSIAIPATVFFVSFYIKRSRHYLIKFVDRFLFWNRYHYNQHILKLSQIAIQNHGMESLINNMKIEIGKSVNAKDVFILPTASFEKEVKTVKPFSHVHNFNDQLMSLLKQYTDAILPDEETNFNGKGFDNIFNMLQEIEYQAAVPIIMEEKCIGLLVIGKRQSDHLVNTIDINFLKSSANILAMAMIREKKQADILLEEKDRAIKKFAVEITGKIEFILSGLQTTFEEFSSTVKGTKRKLVYSMDEQIGQLNKINSSIIEYISPHQTEAEIADINLIVKLTVDLFISSRPDLNLNITTNFDHNLPTVYVDVEQIRLLCVNLLLNAKEAANRVDNARLVIKGHTVKVNGSNFLQITFLDNCGGTEDRNVKKIFEPFYSENNQGIGLGLSIVESIVENNSGKIAVKNQEGRGMEFNILFPVYQQ